LAYPKQFWLQRSPHMKETMLACLALVLVMSLGASAQKQEDQTTQDTTKTGPQEKQAPKPANNTKTVTGCMQKGDEAGEFAITGEDGKTWDLRSSSVKLDQHVGHKVTVSGLVTHESKAEEKKEGQVEKASSKEEYGDIRVTSLKMVSDSCGK
jgi:hypothetical protein